MDQHASNSTYENVLKDLRLLADSGNLRAEDGELVFFAENQAEDEKPFSFEELLESLSYELTAEQVGELRSEMLPLRSF